MIRLCQQSIQVLGSEVEDEALKSRFDAVTKRVWSKPLTQLVSNFKMRHSQDKHSVKSFH